jgi:AcrR family transcriptional regulator
MPALRNPEKTRNSLLAAGARVLRRHYLDTSGDQSVVPVSAADIVAETAALDAPEFVGVSTGAVKTAFGTKDDLLRAAAAAYGREWFETRYRPKSLMSESHSMRLFLEDHLRDVSGHMAESRHWLQISAHAGDPSLREMLDELSTRSMEDIAVICELSGDLEGRAPRSGRWSDVAAVILTWLEGVDVRLSQTEILESEVATSQIVEAGVILWTGLTVSIATDVSESEADSEPSLTFVSAFDFDEIEHWLDDQSKLVRARARLRKTKLHVPQFVGLGYKPEVTATVLLKSAGSRNSEQTAMVALSLISESDSHAERGREVKVTIVSVDGREYSACIDGWGKRPTAEIDDVPITKNSPRDLTVRWEVAEQGA